MSTKPIRCTQYAIGKSFEEIHVNTDDCPIKRHTNNKDCCCIMKSAYAVFTQPCEYYEGYTDSKEGKETVITVKCGGEGKPIAPSTYTPMKQIAPSYVKVSLEDEEEISPRDEEPSLQEQEDEMEDDFEPTSLFDFM